MLTCENPADIGPRGAVARELVESEKWPNGPEYLHNEIDKWPFNKVPENESVITTEIKKEARKPDIEVSCTYVTLTFEKVLDPKRY